MAGSIKNIIRKNLLTILTIFGVILGILFGILLRELNKQLYTSRQINYINFIGDLYLRILKSLILPLIITSLISAIGNLDFKLSKKIGLCGIIYYIITTIIAVILGIILVITIKPGINKQDNNDINNNNNIEDIIQMMLKNNNTDDIKKSRNITTVDTLLDLIRNMFPPNLIQACTMQYQTVLKPPTDFVPDLELWKVDGEFVNGMNILGLVVASIIFGIVLSANKKEAITLLLVFEETSHIMMKITGWITWLSPIGIIFLICSKLIEMESIDELFGKLGLYFLTVAGGILFHGFIILPSIYFLLTRKNPYGFMGNMAEALATAFGTASSSATLPVTIKCLEEKNKIDSRISRFILPIGATINMDGTALYEAVAAIFIAQIRGISLSFGNIIAISITATAASIGAAGIPHAGLVTIIMVLDAVGLPAEDVSLIIAVDWLLDRIRTMVNVLGDSIGAAIVAHLSEDELDNNFDKNEFELNVTRSSISLFVNAHNTIDQYMY